MERMGLIDELQQRLGGDVVLVDAEAVQPYRADWTGQSPINPAAVVLVRDVEDVAEALHQAALAGLPVVARGAGTGLSGGARPQHGGVVLAMQGMDKIEQVDLPNRRALVQPGLITYELSRHLSEAGYFYAPDPASWKLSTLGGNIAENSGGPRCLKYGVTTNHVLALEVVLTDGTTLWTGDGVQDAAGYDLTGLFVGSEGTFGIVTRALVRLTRTPEANRVLLALFPDVVAACATVSATLAAGYLPTALEVMDATTMRAVNTAFGYGLPEQAGAALIVEIDGVHDGLDEVMEAISELCQTYGAIDVRRATSLAEQEQLWAARRSAFQAFPALAPAFYLIDTVVPRTRLPEMMARVAELSQRYNMPIANVFHAGDGNLHPLALYDPADPAQVATAHAISSEVLRLSLELGGTLSGEHGIGVEKQNYMTTLWGASELQALATVYQVFNPADRLNPGKVFPAGISPQWLALQRQERIAAERQLIEGEVSLEQLLRDAVGTEYLLRGTDTAAYAVQGHTPRYVAMPGSIEELGRAMAACHRVGATVTPWGGGSQQSQGTVERAPDVVVVTRRLNSVLRYEPDDLTIGVGAGMTLAELQAVLATHNQMLPLDAPLPERATLGGLVATATDGPRRLGYGTLRDLLLGLTIVEVDGTITRLGGQVVKNVSGFDLVRLVLGSHGTLGIIAEVRLRTLPLAPAESTLLATFRTRAAALVFSNALQTLPLTPTAVEYLDGGALWHIGTTGGAGVAVRAEGVPAACARHTRDAAALARRHGAIETRELTGADHQELWAAVGNLSATTLAPGETLLRLAVAPADLGAALDDLETLLRRWGASVAVNARAHNGVIYARVRCPAELARLQDALAARWGHSHVLATQHSSGEPLRVWGAQPQGHAPMRAIKQLFDPFETLNPGRYVV